MPDNANRGLISTPWIRQLVIRLLNNWSQHLFDVAISLCVKETITCTDYVYVVVNFLFQLIFIFPLFWGMVMYANEFKTKEKQKLTEIKN